LGWGWFSDTSTTSFEGRNDLKKTIMNKLGKKERRMINEGDSG